ncbi:dihydrodipicolinate synthase family protein [Candidatus Bipolaricaulota bacterium]|nr:dihydrodipicolinate synthase family protein [Candidatus Bipolaricaulota bacterium]
MQPQEAKQKLKGPCIPVITPFNEDYSLDLDSLEANVNYLLDHGISQGRGFLLIGGAGGEFPMLDTEERKKVAKTVVDTADGDVATIVGAQHTDTASILELARYAKKIGADAVQASHTFYYEPSAEDVYRLFSRVNEIGISIMVYNTPWEGFNIGPDLMERLANLENVVSFKWAAPTVAEYKTGLRNHAEDLAMVDNMGLTPFSHMMGCTGFITHVANYWPEHELEILDLMEEGKYEQAYSMTEEFNFPWYKFRGKMSGRTGGEANVIKPAMEMVGLQVGPPRPPTRPMNDEERAELRKLLEEGGVPLGRV